MLVFFSILAYLKINTLNKKIKNNIMKKLSIFLNLELLAIINILLITAEFWNNLPVFALVHISAIVFAFHKLVK